MAEEREADEGDAGAPATGDGPEPGQASTSPPEAAGGSATPSSSPGAAPRPGAGTAEGDALAAAERAFDAGDYRALRRLCEGLLEARDPEVAAAARELVRRTQVDPVQIGVILACLVLLGVIAYVYVL